MTTIPQGMIVTLTDMTTTSQGMIVINDNRLAGDGCHFSFNFEFSLNYAFWINTTSKPHITFAWVVRVSAERPQRAKSARSGRGAQASHAKQNTD